MDKDELKDYLKEHLKISIDTQHGYYHDVTVEVKLILEGNEISSSSYYFTEGD